MLNVARLLVWVATAVFPAVFVLPLAPIVARQRRAAAAPRLGPVCARHRGASGRPPVTPLRVD